MNDQLKKWCRANWDRIPELIRNDCINHLEGWIPVGVIQEWKKLGYSEGFFHFHHSVGMHIRNRLRDQLTDGELPVVTLDPEGKPYGPAKDWDDYYTGALDEFLERHNEDGTKK